MDEASLARPSSQNTLTPQTRPKTQASHRSQTSVTSFLSATSIGSDDEPLLIHKVDPVRTFAGMEEPNWDLIRKKTSTESQFSPEKNHNSKITVNTRELGSDSNSISSTGTSSPILSPLSTDRTGSSVFSPRHEPVSFLPPPRTSSRPEAQQHQPQKQNQSQIPTIEVSVARSVSLAKSKKQVLVPVRPKASRLNSSHERLVARQAKTPTVTEPAIGHRPHHSQDARIETMV